MPNISLPINDLESSVERPVVLDVIRQLMDITEISSKTPIRFYGSEGKAAQANSLIVPDGVQNFYPYSDKVQIEVDEDYDLDRLYSIYTKQPDAPLIFRDSALKVSIKPIYSPCNVVVKVKYRSRDKNQGAKWRNDIRIKTAMMRDINMHDLKYSYHLQEKYLLILEEIHRLREAVDGYSETFQTWFHKRLTDRASVVTNLSGQTGLWAIAEDQIGVQGIFGFPDVPDKPEREGDGDAWTTSFEYKFSYEKPTHCNMIYPVIIHQQVLSEKFRNKEKAYSLVDKVKYRTLSGTNYAHFQADEMQKNVTGNEGLDIPSFDEFIPNSIPTSTIKVFTALSTISEADKRSLINLNDLGDFVLDHDILNFIKLSEYPFIGKTFQSIFCLNLYENEYLREEGSLVVDSALNVTALTPNLSLRSAYRIRLSLVTNFALLNPAALSRLKNHPVAALKIASAINASIGDKAGHPDIKRNTLAYFELRQMGLDPNNIYKNFGLSQNPPLTPSKYFDPTNVGMNLVQSLFVSVKNIAKPLDPLDLISFPRSN